MLQSTTTNSRENSYDFVRFLAASAVLFSHHFALSAATDPIPAPVHLLTGGLPEPPVPLYGADFGKLAVAVFFCLSGFLICQSLQKSKNWANFFAARALRILPNLTFILLLTSTFTMVWFHNYDNLWPHIKYVIRNLLMVIKGVGYTIPGVFEDSINHAVNGPLWSLPTELWLYVLLFFAFAIVRLTLVVTLIIALAMSIGWALFPEDYLALGPVSAFQLCRLGSFFFCGAAIAFIWPRICHWHLMIGVTAVLLLVLVRNTIDFETILHPLALALAVIGLGQSKAMAWFAKGGDASYGMYILAWPVQQFSIILIENFWLSMAAAFLTTVGLGYMTWHAFERRAMSHRHQLAAWMHKCCASLDQRYIPDFVRNFRSPNRVRSD